MVRQAGLSREARGFLAWQDAFELADRGRVFEGRLPVAVFQRFSELLAAVEGEVEARLAFVRGGEGRVRVEGHVEGGVMLICQRCLGRYRQPLSSRVGLILVTDEALIPHLPGEFEHEVVSDRIRPLDLLEDELMMSLPLVPVHPEPADCEETARRLLAAAHDEPME